MMWYMDGTCCHDTDKRFGFRGSMAGGGEETFEGCEDCGAYCTPGLGNWSAPGVVTGLGKLKQ